MKVIEEDYIIIDMADKDLKRIGKLKKRIIKLKDSSESIQELECYKEELKNIIITLNKLQSKDQNIIALKYFEKLNSRKISEKMNLSGVKIKKYLNTALLWYGQFRFDCRAESIYELTGCL